MTEDVVVIGAGGFGRETLDVIEAHNRAYPDEALAVRGIADDAPSADNLARLAARGYRHLGTTTDVLNTLPPGRYVIGIGSPALRRTLAALFGAAGWTATTIIHPAASVGSAQRIGIGVVVCGGVQLSTNTLLGDHVHINPNATVGHDAQLRDFVSVNPGAIISGDTVVGEGVLVGAGAVILQGLTVGNDAQVGASACVTRSVPGRVTVVGVPARPIDDTAVTHSESNGPSAIAASAEMREADL